MKKLLYQKQSRIFEKVVSRGDKLFRVQFVILEKGGKLLGKIVACDEIHAIRTTNEIRKYEKRVSGFYSPFSKGSTRVGEGERFYLPAWKHFHKVKDERLKIKDSYVSPYFNCFEFLTCIQIRAPAYTAD